MSYHCILVTSNMPTSNLPFKLKYGFYIEKMLGNTFNE